jgi:hypothetical protein
VRTYVAILFGLFALLSWYCLWYLPGTELADFSVYREAARALLRGENIYGQGFGVSQREAPLTLGYLYPPLLAVIMSWGERAFPRTVPLAWCAILWASLLATAFFLAQFWKEISKGARDNSFTLLLGKSACLLSLWPPLWDGLMWGQVNPLVLLALVGSMTLGVQGKHLPSGACIAVGAALKATPAIVLLPFLVFLRWRGIAGFIAVLIVLGAMSAASPRGVQVYFDFLNALEVFSSAPLSIDPYYDYGLQKLLGHAAGKYAALLLLGIYAVSILALGRSRGVRNNERVPYGILLGVPIMILISPCIWFHHLLWILPPLVFGYVLWGKDEKLRNSRGLVFSTLFIGLGFSLYLQVIARHHLHFGELAIKIMVPSFIFAVFLCLVCALLRGARVAP